MKERKVSEAVIHRLPKYYRYLQELQKKGIERISSSELAEEMGLNASQIRQDFNCFGGFGQQGYGYHIDNLLSEIQAILGLNKPYKLVLMGAGNMGHAIANYRGFQQEGFEVAAIFDHNPVLVGEEINGVKIQHADEVETYLAENVADIGIICTPKENAQAVCDRLVFGGIRAIWNFAPVDIENEKAVIENVHLSDFLYILTYRLGNEKTGTE